MKKFLWFLALIAAAGLIWLVVRPSGQKPPEGEEVRRVRAAAVERGDLPVMFQALGTAVPENTALVRSRVDGVLTALHFTEGGMVKAGDLLAEIDPRPFQTALAKARGTLARDEALLRDARLDLARYRKLVREGSVSAQQLQAQEGTVGRYEGDVAADKAAVDDAALQLEYSRVTAPISGMAGLKKVDLGNMIRASDTTGIVSIAQMDPMTVIFTLVERRIPAVQAGMAATPGGLKVEAWDQDNAELLETGRLLTLDNAIDPATGTVKARAVFPNAAGKLFPNRFINVRLLVETLSGVPLAPASALQRGDAGFYVFVVKADNKVEMRPVELGPGTDARTVITRGLEPGERVVVDGVDRLRDGTPVQVMDKPGNTNSTAPMQGNGNPSGMNAGAPARGNGGRP